MIEDELSIPCHVLMGANLAGEVAQEMFVEATIGNVFFVNNIHKNLSIVIR